MDLKAVELLTEREFSLDKELRSIGVSNLISALCGMAIEFHGVKQQTWYIQTEHLFMIFFPKKL